MRYIHKHVAEPGRFQVPFARWLLPALGALLCVLLMIKIPGGTWIRLLVWMALGHVCYFSYGFWFSKRRTNELSCASTAELTSGAQSMGAETPRIPTPIRIDGDIVEYHL